MMRSSDTSSRLHGFTLIELLLYVSLVGALLLAISLFFIATVEARLKNQSISEVNQQGAAAMEYLTQTIRNADSITSPGTGTSGSSLTLAVPTGSLSPTIFDTSGGGSTVMGYNVDGGSTDSADSNFINATKFTASASGTITTLYALVGPTIGTTPNNQAQMAIYNGTAAAPTTMLGKSSSTTLTASSWIAFTIPTVSVTSGQIYWLAYNTNGTTAAQNNLRFHIGTTGQTAFGANTFGTWPGSWLGGSTSNDENSMYALITSGGGPGVLQVKEGTGAAVPLTSNDVTISNLTFKNLSRSGTPGIVQASFTVTRVNTSGRNEYDYQQTFTSSVALR